MIELYHYPLSPCGEKVRFCLAEKGLEWREHFVDLGQKHNLHPEYLRLNPKGYVPTLVDDAIVLCESTIINEYLDDRYVDPPLKPRMAAARAEMRRWTKYVDEVLHPAWPGLAWPILVRPAWLAKSREDVASMLAKLPDPARRERQSRLYEMGLDAPEFKDSLATLSRTLSNMEKSLQDKPWLAGETPSLADLAVLPYPFAASAFGLRPWIEAHGPKVADWYARLLARGRLARLIETGFRSERMAEVARLGEQVLSRLGTAPAGAAPSS